MNKEQEALKLKLGQIWSELNNNLPEINFNDDDDDDDENYIESNDIESVNTKYITFQCFA
jgi:hypothetical protein